MPETARKNGLASKLAGGTSGQCGGGVKAAVAPRPSPVEFPECLASVVRSTFLWPGVRYLVPIFFDPACTSLFSGRISPIGTSSQLAGT